MIIRFDDMQAQDILKVGGKARSLAELTGAGFQVPPGFVVSTDAQSAFFAAHGLDTKIAGLLAGLDYDDVARLETVTAEVRALIEAKPLPADLSAAITDTYGQWGADVHVAVRSSGTAEDLAEASFAGLHDTYLDVRGSDALLLAVRRCWASMWTARATAYRQRGGFDHATARIAVVVQRMIAAEVAGVMFTANPLNLRTDEIVLNASWGLGEGVVSGILTPDTFVVAIEDLAIRRQTLGDKAVQVVRAAHGVGTETRDTPHALRDIPCLAPDKVRALATLGREVMEHCEGLPQDIEWAFAGGELYVLQARPITGVEFTWDEDVDAWHTAPEQPDTVWTHTWAEQFLTGGVTPLFSSLWAWACEENWRYFSRLYGFEELNHVRWFKYRRATWFFNCDAEKIWQKGQWPAALRDLTNIPPAWQAEFARDETSLLDVGRLFLRLHIAEPKHGLFGWFRNTYAWIDGKIPLAKGPTVAELERLSDRALRRQCEHSVKIISDFFETLWPGFSWIAPACFGMLNSLLGKWYDGDAASVFQDLIAGIPDTALVHETEDLWRLVDAVKASPKVRECLNAHEDVSFFRALEGFAEGRAFLEQYARYVDAHGHRGHPDRDIYYKRRAEDSTVDFLALRSLQNADDSSRPEQVEARLVARRTAATEAVVQCLLKQPFGGLKVEVFKAVLGYTLRFMKFRDDERYFLDRMTLQMKRSFAELGRRLHARGILDGPEDFFFLARHELYEVADRRTAGKLVRAKVAGRRAVFERRNARLEHTVTYFQGDTVLPLEHRNGIAPPDDGSLRGLGTSRGEVTGRARVVRSMHEIGRVQKDDILVCNSTDPGWMPVFPMIKGLVLETGGMLAHGACLSREYGLPAVQLRNAIALIEDGAEIRINGDSGAIHVIKEAAAAVA
ncbi:MAG: PEP/pyruvate-binding domain-containing protein [Gammaproteobacteria bacterium]